MPASARLLERLMETLGHEATGDLVAWMSEAGTVNRVELRELADLYFGRLDVRLEERFATAEARIEARFTLVEGRLGKVEDRLAGMEVRLAHAEARLDGRISSVRDELRLEIAGLRTVVAEQGRDLMKWMFIFWAGTILPLAGLIIALHRL